MAGKAPALTPRRLHYALDHLSKNALIDLVTDLAMKQIGADEPEEALAAQIQEWIDPVLRVRGDKPFLLSGLIAKRDRNDEDCRNRTGKYRLVPGYEGKP